MQPVDSKFNLYTKKCLFAKILVPLSAYRVVMPTQILSPAGMVFVSLYSVLAFLTVSDCQACF
jgi:hypothetical protein